MGLMDKFKNLFTDEEIIEEDEIEETVKIKEIKNEETKEHKLPTFMREKIEKEEKTKQEKSKESINKSLAKRFENIEKEENIDNNLDITEEKIIEKKTEFKFPVFDESDFVEPSRVTRHSNRKEEAKEPQKNTEIREHKIDKPKEVNIKSETKVSKLYKDKIVEKKDDKKFKASPIISPIFGVLDKNYVPSDVSTNNGDNYEINRRSKTIDFDSVRKKAYGTEKKTLEDDIKENLDCKNCEYLKKAKSCKKKEQDNDIMYEALCESNSEEFKDISIEEAEENFFDYGSIYEKKQDIDPIYLDESDENKEVNIVNHIDEEIKETPKRKKKEVPPVKSSINLLSTIKKSMGDEEIEENNNTTKKKNEKDLELTDDLFNLIDSMYEERDD